MALRLATLIGLPLLAAAMAALPWLPWSPAQDYAVLLIGASLAFLALTWPVLRVSLRTGELTALLVLLLALRAGFLFATPIGSDDWYRYAWDGKVQAAGINPYRFSPNAPDLAALHSDTLPRLVNHPYLVTPYFPVAQWVFRLAYAVGGESVVGLKMLLLFAEALSVVALLLLLRDVGRPRERVLLYAAAPLTVYQFALDAHVDAVGFPFLLFGLLLYLRAWKATGLVLLALAISIKPTPAVVLPLLALSETTWRARLRVLVVPAAVVALQFAPYGWDADVFAGLYRLARNWMFNASVFSLVFAVVRDNQRARLICAGLLTLVLLGIYAAHVRARGRDTLGRSAQCLLAVLLFSPVVHPWYVGWLAVLLPVAPLRSGLVFVSTVGLASLTVVTYHATGVWTDYPAVRLAVYVPVFVALMWEWRQGRTGSAGTP